MPRAPARFSSVVVHPNYERERSLGLHEVARGRYTLRDFPFGEAILHHRARRGRLTTRILPLTRMLAFLALASRAARAQDTSGVTPVTEPDLGQRAGNVVHVVATAVYGGTGALMGALVGRSSSHWERRWPGAR